MSILPLPSDIVDRIYIIYRGIMWTTNPLIAWAEMCKPKEEGGVGIIDLIAWNLVLIANVL